MGRYLILFFLLYGMLQVSVTLHSQEGDDDKGDDVTKVPAVDSVKRAYDSYLASAKGAKDRYIKILQSLADSEQKKGNLEGIEELKPEINKMNEPATIESTAEFKNQLAKKAQESFQREMGSFKSKYIADLQRAQTDEVKAGKIDNAKQIRAYIAALGVETPDQGNDIGINKKDDTSLKTCKIQILPASDLFVKQKKSIAKPIESVSASSFYDDKYKPDFSCDSNESTEWAVKGTSGTLEFQLKKNIAARTIIFIGRSGPSDNMTKGKIKINSKYDIPFVGFNGGTALVLVWPQIKTGIKSIKVECLEGTGHPGISEIYISDK